MSEPPEAFLSHRIFGRLRVRIPSKKGDTTYFIALKDKLSKYNFVEKIEANPLTGSVLFIHKGDFKAISKIAEANNIFRLNEFKANAVDIHMTLLSTYKSINNHIKHYTGGRLDLSALAFLSLAGLGIYQISRGNFAAPAWYTAFWYALNIFLKSKPAKDAE